MDNQNQQAKFDGWAIVEVMGHQRFAGYVTTEAYGQAVLFRIDVPALEPRERVTERPGYILDRGYTPAGATVKEGAVQGFTKLVGSGSIYCITPCTKEAALKAVEQIQPRPLMAIEIPPGLALPHGQIQNDDDNDRYNEADPDEFEEETF